MKKVNPYSERLRALLKKQEGLRLEPYKDSLGFLTIGYGHNLEEGITLHTANAMLTEDIRAAISTAMTVLSPIVYKDLNESQKIAIISMAFQLGKKMFQFKRFIKHMKAGDHQLAAVEMRDSLWYKQTPKRVDELINLLGKES